MNDLVEVNKKKVPAKKKAKADQTTLVVMEKMDLVPVFTEGKGLDDIIDMITKEAKSFVHSDLSKKINRDAVTAMATKVQKSKTYLEDNRKLLSAKYKELPKIIDANGKKVRDTLTELQAFVRQPLTDWEADRLAAKLEKEAEAEAKKIAKEKKSDHELADLLNKQFDQQIKDDKAEAEENRKAHEQHLQEVAANAATDKAEKAALAERNRIENERLEAINKQQVAEENLRLSEKKRLADIETARLNEIARQQHEIDKAAHEQKLKDADENHRSAVNNMAKNDFMEIGLSEDQAKNAVRALIRGQISHSKLTY